MTRDQMMLAQSTAEDIKIHTKTLQNLMERGLSQRIKNTTTWNRDVQISIDRMQADLDYIKTFTSL